MVYGTFMLPLMVVSAATTQQGQLQSQLVASHQLCEEAVSLGVKDPS